MPPEGTSALPGRVRLWPYQREIADAISDPMLERVTLVKGVRLGFTTLLTGAIGGYVANEHAAILALLPTDSDARDYVVSELEPIFSATPALRAGERQRRGRARNTITSTRFADGSLRVIAARAPRNLRRVTARILLIDEADAMEVTAEGNPSAGAPCPTAPQDRRRQHPACRGHKPRPPRLWRERRAHLRGAVPRVRHVSMRSLGATSSGRPITRRRRPIAARRARRSSWRVRLQSRRVNIFPLTSAKRPIASPGVR